VVISDAPPGAFAVLVGNMAGQIYVPGPARDAAAKMAALKQSMPAGAIMDAGLYRLMRHRQLAIYSSLLVWADLWRDEVLGRQGGHACAPQVARGAGVRSVRAVRGAGRRLPPVLQRLRLDDVLRVGAAYCIRQLH
jgi:hypothetical protein